MPYAIGASCARIEIAPKGKGNSGVARAITGHQHSPPETTAAASGVAGTLPEKQSDTGGFQFER
jgi:hypothetical protein